MDTKNSSEIEGPNSLQKGIEIVKEAVEQDTKGLYADALKSYTRSLHYFVAAMKCLFVSLLINLQLRKMKK